MKIIFTSPKIKSIDDLSTITRKFHYGIMNCKNFPTLSKPSSKPLNSNIIIPINYRIKLNQFKTF